MKLHWEEVGEGPPLVLLHGFGGSTKNWQRFTPELSKHFRCVLVDLRGHGYSLNPSGVFTHAAAAEDVLELMEALGLARCAAMGLSTGAMTLLHLATRQPERIEAMVLVSATTHFPESARAIMRRASLERVPPEVREMYLACAPRGEAQVRELLRQFNALAESRDDMNFSAERLAGITARTLVVHGDRDAFFPPSIAETLAREIPGAALWRIADGDHVPVLDEKVPFVTRALAFLRA